MAVIAVSALAGGLLGWAVASASAAPGEEASAPTFPDPPPAGRRVIDDAGLLGADGAAAIEAACARAREEHGVPARVVIVDSIARRGALPSRGWRVRSWARALFHRWASPQGAAALEGAALRAVAERESEGAGGGGAPAVGEEKETVPGGGEGANFAELFGRRGVLVVLSRRDRRVAVETGREWLARADQVSRARRALAWWLDRRPPAEALVEGFAAISELAAGREVRIPGSWIWLALAAGIPLIFLSSVVSFSRQGTEGVAWRTWLALFSALGWALTFLVRRGVNLGSSFAGGRGPEPGGARLVIGHW